MHAEDVGTCALSSAGLVGLQVLFSVFGLFPTTELV